jgi:hypothetical protein
VATISSMSSRPDTDGVTHDGPTHPVGHTGGHPGAHPRRHLSGLSSRTRLLITLLAVFIGIPAVLFAWIGGVLLTDAWELEMSSTQVLAWILAALAGVVVWPVALRRLRRELWNRQYGAEVPAPGSGHPERAAASRPRDSRAMPAPSTGEAIVRSVIVVLGAIGIIALSGPLDIVAAVSSAGATVAIGPRENGLLLQLVAMIVILALAAPSFLLTQRALRRMAADDPRRAAVEDRQNWHFAAATAWVVSLLVGYLLSLAALITM